MIQALDRPVAAVQAAPEDVVAYCEEWKEPHGETVLPSGGGGSTGQMVYPAPSTLEGIWRQCLTWQGVWGTMGATG